MSEDLLPAPPVAAPPRSDSGTGSRGSAAAGVRRRRTVISLLAAAGAWELIAQVSPKFDAPGWESIGRSFGHLDYAYVGVTAVRVAVALVLSFAIGLILAAVLAQSPRTHDYLMPLVKITMAVPVVCWIMFSVLWFANIEYRIAFVLVVVCAPVFLVDCLEAMRSIAQPLRDVMKSLGATRWELHRTLVIPAIVPAILTSWRINLSLAVRVVTMAELVGAVSGVGYALNVAEQTFDVADVFAWTVILVGMLLAAEAALGAIEHRMLRWRVTP